MWTDDLDLLIDQELVVVRWRRPTVDAANSLHRVMTQHRTELGRPLFFAILIGPDCPTPDLATRDALLRGYDRITSSCQTLRMVLLAGGLRQTVMRSVVTALNIAASLRGQRVHVDRDVRDLAGVVEQMLGRPSDATIQQLIEAGLLDPNEIV